MQSYVTNETSTKMKDETLITIFRDPDAWSCLDPDKQRELYALLPLPAQRDTPIDTSVSPLRLEPYAQHIKAFLAHVEGHLERGAGTRAWRVDAQEASRKRAEGKYDALIEDEEAEDEPEADRSEQDAEGLAHELSGTGAEMVNEVAHSSG